MKVLGKWFGLIGILVMAGAQAQNLAAIQHPIPEAPSLSQGAHSAVLDGAMQRVPQLDTAGLLAHFQARPDTVVIDVRTAAELANLGGRIDAPRFANLLRGWLEFQIEAVVPDKATPIVVYCGVSQRSPLAAETLIRIGYTDVKNYRDGFFNWRRAGLPVYVLPVFLFLFFLFFQQVSPIKFFQHHDDTVLPR